MTAHRQRVLVVEDDPGVAVLQRRRLERAGFRVEVAEDVDTAMARLADSGADLVVIDYRLEGPTGLDLHRRMKAAGFTVPVIIVSGSMTETAVIEALRAGVRDVIVKTIDYLDYLPEAVRGVLQQTAASPGVKPHGARIARVLVVEDDPGVATLERRQLERAGYDVVVAARPEEAVAAVQGGGISLAVLDLRLADGASGLDLYQRLKAEGWNIPAILVTAFADQGVTISALRAGIRDFVPKSADYLEHLPAAVDRVFEQVRIERKLVESELRLASIIGTTMDAIVMCDEAQRVVLFNRAAEEMFGCAAAAALERPIQDFLPGLVIGDVSPGGLRIRTEVEGRGNRREPVPIEVSVSDVVVHGERLFTVIARDISERRRIEAELREADRRKDQFLGMLAHELRNPLAAVMAAGEVLHREVEGTPAQKLTAVVRRQTRTLARMADDLLDVSRVTLGKIQLAREPVLLGEIVARAGEHARERAAAAGVVLEVSAPSEPVWLDGDPTRLDQVLMNLLNNALKFTPAGGHVTLAAEIDGDQALIRVRDTGIGIEPQLLPHVFDLFVQADTSLDRAQSGLGIGLALVHQLVALHGGQVTASSGGPGRGAEFVVRLPVSRDKGLEAAEAGGLSPSGMRRLRVLVVDDQADNADLFALLAEAFGHKARAAYGGEEGLSLARRTRPDVMFVDVGMPGMNGYEVAQAIRQDPSLAGVRLVAVTGYGRDEDRARAFEAGFDRHLTKPVDDVKLRTLLDEFAGRGHPAP
jgi:PAS domain S-box-containing protein